MKYLVLALFLFYPFLLRAQKIPDYGTSQVRINDTDRMIRAGILTISATFKARPDRLYYWYGSGGIRQTQGGYSGRLLHGNYEEYYLDKNLRTQGTFAEGLKDGQWKEWHETGSMKRLVTWKQGEQTGPFQLYGANGKITTSGYYRHNLQDGSITYNMGTDSVKTLRYKAGKLIPAKKGNFLKRIHIFKKGKAPAAKPAP
ncbi:hypothetical protein SNE25_10030 [Mucilaginibacter sabulilitoris]|uniref:Toxin-antitoxin system YwqK family antitoxin n=1 Tax=Mucilaginibacter sabulilitoris TaxID=1173583 RepID=A0ABZ0TWN1_9SPHI|nr:hypothetical protein [Mucilaginibacter sabulilitoris]WPU95855.1 hypothetical protein SNE25_10030 [Mucilaginibacter sabulilitoris]